MTHRYRISRRALLTLLASSAGAAAFVACSGSDNKTGATSTPSNTPGASPSSTTLPPSPTATASIGDPTTVTPTPQPTATPVPSVSVETMIGQMLLVGFRGYGLDTQQPIYDMFKSGRVGNTVLFDYDVPSSGAQARNVQSPQQVAFLTTQIQSLMPTPALISTDQEGGEVARLGPQYGFPRTISEQDLGAQNDPDKTQAAGADIGKTLAAAGINLDLAPVVDVNVNPNNPIIGALERSFSSDPEVVARQALAYIDGLHSAGVLSTLKHFPGHGSSTADSHLGFVDVSSTWSQQELIPFQRVIEAGRADAVMTAHIFNSNLDPKYPATLSKATITGVLRDQLGFDGVVLTDDMQMGAIRNYYSFNDALEAAINAGADVISLSNNGDTYNPTVGDDAFNAILDAVHAGRITEDRIHDSYQRIMKLKARLT